jgi:lipoprotein-anchoring transpeptidase ErfK/SrfK
MRVSAHPKLKTQNSKLKTYNSSNMCRLDPVRNARQRTLKTHSPKLQTQNVKRFLFVCVMLGCLSRATFAQYSVQLDLTEQKAYLLYHDRSVMESPICSGRPGHLTPTGTFHITNKDLNHVSSIYGRIVDRWKRTVVADADVDMPTPAGTRFINAPMRYFMEFAPGIGMHAGYLPGYPASHGCVRMPEQNAIAFFQAVSVGTPVTVFGSIPRNRQYQVNNRDDNQRYYNRFYNDPRYYYRGRVFTPPPFGFWPFGL